MAEKHEGEHMAKRKKKQTLYCPYCQRELKSHVFLATHMEKCPDSPELRQAIADQLQHMAWREQEYICTKSEWDANRGTLPSSDVIAQHYGGWRTVARVFGLRHAEPTTREAMRRELAEADEAAEASRQYIAGPDLGHGIPVQPPQERTIYDWHQRGWRTRTTMACR